MFYLAPQRRLRRDVDIPEWLFTLVASWEPVAVWLRKSRRLGP